MAARENEIGELLQPSNREKQLDEVLSELTGGKSKLEHGSGLPTSAPCAARISAP